MDYVKALQKVKFHIAVAQTLTNMLEGSVENDLDEKTQVDLFIRNNNQAMREMACIGDLVGILADMGNVFLRRAVDKNLALVGFGEIAKSNHPDTPTIKRWLSFQESSKTHGDVWAFFETENNLNIPALDEHPHRDLSLGGREVTLFGCLSETH